MHNAYANQKNLKKEKRKKKKSKKNPPKKTHFREASEPKTPNKRPHTLYPCELSILKVTNLRATPYSPILQRERGLMHKLQNLVPESGNYLYFYYTLHRWPR